MNSIGNNNLQDPDKKPKPVKFASEENNLAKIRNSYYRKMMKKLQQKGFKGVFKEIYT
jgi:hypothetical protein